MHQLTWQILVHILLPRQLHQAPVSLWHQGQRQSLAIRPESKQAFSVEYSPVVFGLSTVQAGPWKHVRHWGQLCPVIIIPQSQWCPLLLCPCALGDLMGVGGEVTVRIWECLSVTVDWNIFQAITSRFLNGLRDSTYYLALSELNNLCVFLPVYSKLYLTNIKQETKRNFILPLTVSVLSMALNIFLNILNYLITLKVTDYWQWQTSWICCYAAWQSSGAWTTWTEPPVPLVEICYIPFAILMCLTVEALSVKANDGTRKCWCRQE
jgi:hypothetical protein